MRDGSGSPGKFCSRAFQSSSLPEAVALNERGTDTRVLRARRLHPAPRSGARILVLVTLPGPRCGVAAKVAGLLGRRIGGVAARSVAGPRSRSRAHCRAVPFHTDREPGRSRFLEFMCEK